VSPDHKVSHDLRENQENLALKVSHDHSDLQVKMAVVDTKKYTVVSEHSSMCQQIE